MKTAASVLFWITTIVLTLATTFVILFFTIVFFPFDRKRKFAHTQGYWWADAIVASNPFWNLTIRGLEHIDPRKAYVVVSNHQSAADIVLLYKIHMQFKWVAKESLFKIPLFGWCMSRMKYIKLSRGEFGSIKKTYSEAAAWLRQGVSVLFFPEGTRSTTGEMNDFKNGAFKIAIKEKKPVLPILIEGSHEVIPKGSWIFKTQAHPVVTVLPEIDTSNLSPGDFAILRDKVCAGLRAAAD